jgi:endonuclease/exonuclease/phosphatase (EEP) superfamily protein YafD
VTTTIRRGRTLARAVAAGFGLGALPVVALDVFPELQPTSPVATVVACGIPYVPIPLAAMCAGLAVASVSRGRRMLWATAAGAVLVGGLRDRFVAPASVEPPPRDRRLTVLSANVLFGRADPRHIVDLAQGVDVVAIQENTPRFDEALHAILAADFPYQLGTSTEDASGTMLWSRTPLEHGGTGDTRFTSVVATTTVRGVQWTVANVHPSPPQMGSRQWARDAQRVLDLVRSHLGEKLVVVGDFNAIEEHLTMRRFAAAGFSNAMSGSPSAGAAAWQPSWPAKHAWALPLIRIDHALHSGPVQAWRPRYTRVRGSDHKALVAVFRAL